MLLRRVLCSVLAAPQRLLARTLTTAAAEASAPAATGLRVAVEAFAEPGKVAGEVVLRQDVFGLPVRRDIMHRAVLYQLAKRRQGTRKTKGISEIRGTTKKPHAQKGSGRARQGSLRSPHMRGGAVIFGPVVRSHAHDLPKKVRALALRTALSAKLAEGRLSVVDGLATWDAAKTRDLSRALAARGVDNALLIAGEASAPDALRRAGSNIRNVDVLPAIGLNVYDALRRHHLVLGREVVDWLHQTRFPSASS